MCGRDEVCRDARDAERDEGVKIERPAAGTGEPYTPVQPRIADRCPSCGGRTLFVGASGWLTCSVIGCRAPGAASAVLAAAERDSMLRGRTREQLDILRDIERLVARLDASVRQSAGLPHA